MPTPSHSPRPAPISQFSWRDWFWLIFGLLWAGLTGVFLALPGVPAIAGWSALAIAIGYAGLVSWRGRPASWIATGLLLGLVLVVGTMTLASYLVAATLSLNIWIFGALGDTWRHWLSPRQTFIRLASSLAGALAIGWLVGLLSLSGA